MDYKKLGFKCGIEIHNRLATKTKLFCNCPADFGSSIRRTIERKLRVVPGEMGNIDPAVLHEFLKDRKFIYQAYDNTCLVDEDEEPPHELNREALEICLQISMLLDSTIYDEIHTMRKTVIDGSNTSGFQRTAIVSKNGSIDTSKGIVKIDSINVEEDSAGIVERNNGAVTYRLDRLGIPLVEIGTSPDIKDPEHAQEVAEKLGMIVRSTGKSQRGIGSTRQDVNVSIKNGSRVEIKGVQELHLIKEVIEKEVKRQLFLVELKNDLLSRKASVGNIEDVTSIFSDTKNKIISKDIKNGKKVYAAKLSGFDGFMKKQIHEGKYLARELTEYAKAFGAGGFFHNEEDLKKMKLENEFNELEKKFSSGSKDIIIIMSGNLRALESVLERASYILVGVPEETRQANPDGSTSFMRPMPGSARLYPETDVMPIKLDKKYLNDLKENLPETWDKKEKSLIEEGLPEDIAHMILRSPYLELYEKLSKKYDKILVSSTLTSTIREIGREGFNVDNIKDEDFKDLFKAVDKGKTAKESISGILKYIAKDKGTVKDAIEDLGLGSLSREKLIEVVHAVFRNNKELVKDKKVKHLMGLVMKEVRGKIDGKTVMDTIKEEIEKV